MAEPPACTFTVKWKKLQFNLEIEDTTTTTINTLKDMIASKTGVSIHHQKLVGLKGKYDENTLLSTLKGVDKGSVKLLVMGSSTAEHESVLAASEDIAMQESVANDLDVQPNATIPVSAMDEDPSPSGSDGEGDGSERSEKSERSRASPMEGVSNNPVTSFYTPLPGSSDNGAGGSTDARNGVAFMPPQWQQQQRDVVRADRAEPRAMGNRGGDHGRVTRIDGLLNQDEMIRVLDTNDAGSKYRESTGAKDDGDTAEGNDGAVRPNICIEGTFADALEKAKREFRMLLLYLHNDDDTQSREFRDNTLHLPAFAEFIDANFLFYPVDVTSIPHDTITQVFELQAYPFLVVFGNTGCMTVLEVIQGTSPTDGDSLIARFFGTQDVHQPLIDAARMSAEDSRLRELLQEEQETDYKAALKADADLIRKWSHDADAAEQDGAVVEGTNNTAAGASSNPAPPVETVPVSPSVKAAIDTANAVDARRTTAVASLPAEPSSDESSTRISVRLPDGSKHTRRFLAHDKLSTVFTYIDTICGDDCLDYRIATRMPRAEHAREGESAEKTLDELGLCPSAAVFVEIAYN